MPPKSPKRFGELERVNAAERDHPLRAAKRVARRGGAPDLLLQAQRGRPELRD